MTKLDSLRSQLADLRRRRQLLRWSAAAAGVSLALLWTLAGAFAIDYVFELTRLQRVILLAGVAGLTVWAVRRLALPWLGQRETELDMALLVERQQRIDSDLVAAIQFESPAAAAWGSRQLETAVIDYVAEFGRGWNIFQGLPRAEASRRMALLAVTLGLLAVAVVLFPRYLSAFLNRLLFGSAHYPTQTEIDRVLINGREVEIGPGAESRFVVPYGRPLAFAVETSGVAPASGHAELRTVASGQETQIELAPPEREALPATGAGPVRYVPPPTNAAGLYQGELPKLIDSLDCQLYLGDAWTDPIRLEVVPLPVVEPRLVARPPDYVRAAGGEIPAGSRQLAVIEGSRVDFTLVCGNKRLASAWLIVEGTRYSLKKRADGAAQHGEASSETPSETWGLDVALTPLARIQKPLHWQAQVVDQDGLELEHPLEGLIRIKADQRPRIAADVVTKHVLPTAAPLIEYRATDDYGIAKLLVRLERIGEDGSAQPLEPLAMSEARLPALGDRLPLKGSYRLNLAPLKLTKGDQLKVTLEAVDYRGQAPGVAAESEPLVFQVTDESGVLAAIAESDERSARQLDAIITRQLGIGGSK